MKKSKWLQNYENQTKELQSKSKFGKKVLLILLPILFLGMGAAVMASNNSPEVDMTPYLIGMGVIFVFIFLMALLLSLKSVKQDAAKGERENLTALLTTDEEVEEFDRQMAETPLCDIQTDSTHHVLFTQDYIVSSFQINGMPHYRFARLRDVARNDYGAMRSDERVLGRMFLIDLLDAQGKKLLGLTVEGTKRMSELEEALKRYCPGIQLKEHKLF